jgi:PBP1b-binding outer membrane lipoprotein LpoB
MNKLLIGGLAVAALALTGCVTATEPEPVVAQTVTPEPQVVTPEPEVVTPEPESNKTDSSASADYMFVSMMKAVDTPSYFLEGELLYLLQDQAKDTCGYIDEGMTSEEITLALVLAFDGSDSDQEVQDAFLSATVASVYSYCPEYQGFWE